MGDRLVAGRLEGAAQDDVSSFDAKLAQ